MALKALEQAGISPKEVQWVFLGPVDAKVALLNGSVDAWATWEPYTTQMVKTNEGQILVSGKGLLPGNTFLAATDSALNDPHKRAALQDYLQRLAGAERWAYANLDSYGKTLGEIIRFPAEIARAQFCQPPVAVAAAGRGNSGPAAGNGGLLSRQRPDPHPA
ncbi:nitrate/sulfonate/bicarbonate ABC transporter periplasmic protein [Klebsiella pneumoniae]|uniref:Nitrate/sulfonate/bicarbonate ABC transporter periplasmic protein n=1 Tax=Klebsiella pneumoniae TaxID=573 RepID=A0A3S5DIB1_KLEPN|nr:nitrate/sulfonate/bicarbonate ABC transporter periplasmic protein [Klebsiella pneumoniae]